jgi:hypothetical protein
MGRTTFQDHLFAASLLFSMSSIIASDESLLLRKFITGEDDCPPNLRFRSPQLFTFLGYYTPNQGMSNCKMGQSISTLGDLSENKLFIFLFVSHASVWSCQIMMGLSIWLSAPLFLTRTKTGKFSSCSSRSFPFDFLFVCSQSS